MKVTGYIDGVLYAVQTDPDAEPVEGYGIVISAPARVRDLLDIHTGRELTLTPVGPSATGGIDTDEGILAILLAHTQVLATVGAPELIEPDREPMVH